MVGRSTRRRTVRQGVLQTCTGKSTWFARGKLPLVALDPSTLRICVLHPGGFDRESHSPRFALSSSSSSATCC